MKKIEISKNEVRNKFNELDTNKKWEFLTAVISTYSGFLPEDIVINATFDFMIIYTINKKTYQINWEELSWDK